MHIKTKVSNTPTAFYNLWSPIFLLTEIAGNVIDKGVTVTKPKLHFFHSFGSAQQLIKAAEGYTEGFRWI